MISKVLVPTDFSQVADNALDFAIDVCKKTNATLCVLYVKSIPMVDASFPSETYQLYTDEIEKVARENLDRLESQRLKRAGVKYDLHSIAGFVSDEIASYAEEHKADLVVMGTTGSSGIEEMLIGSNTASVVGKSHIPVFVIPPTVTHEKGFSHIVYATDYNEPEFPAISRLIFFADLYGAKITVLHVKTEFDFYMEAERNFFELHKSSISRKDIRIVNMENIELTDAINKCIEEEGADMVVLAKHNRSWFEKLFHRSFSKQMTYHTKVPLLVLNK